MKILQIVRKFIRYLQQVFLKVLQKVLNFCKFLTIHLTIFGRVLFQKKNMRRYLWYVLRTSNPHMYTTKAQISFITNYTNYIKFKYQGISFGYWWRHFVWSQSSLLWRNNPNQFHKIWNQWRAAQGCKKVKGHWWKSVFTIRPKISHLKIGHRLLLKSKKRRRSNDSKI